jgi:hypothetical protein
LGIDYHLFDEEACDEALDDVQGDDNVDEVEVPMPGQLDVAKWVEWHESLVNYLSIRKSNAGAPLSYVVRIEPCETPERLDFDPHLQAVYHAPLQGVNFRKDACQVFSIIKQLVLKTTAWDIINNEEMNQDGRRLIMALRDFFDGPQAKLTRITAVHHTIRTLFYKSESLRPFSMFVTQLTVRITSWNGMDRLLLRRTG